MEELARNPLICRRNPGKVLKTQSGMWIPNSAQHTTKKQSHKHTHSGENPMRERGQLIALNTPHTIFKNISPHTAIIPTRTLQTAEAAVYTVTVN